jgi:hypothetical protein
MYFVEGTDGNKYGPLNLEQVKQYIRERRVTGQTPARIDGTEEWKPLSTYPEFAEALGAAPRAGTPLNLGASPEAVAYALQVIGRNRSVRAGDCISRAWQLYQSDFGPIFGVVALIWLLVFASSSTAAGLVLLGPLLAGLYTWSLKRIRSQPAQVSDAFTGFTNDFVPTMVAGLIASVLTGVGFSLCVLPGIYLYAAWAFVYPLITERRLHFWDALEVSRQVVTHRWFDYGTLLLLTLLINLAGLCLCGIGIFLTLPITTLAWMYAYEDTFGELPAA